MVFFDCNACGESIKKNQVEKHYQFKCRNCNVLSCVDCGKSFVGDAYKEHNKCMTEDQKYGGLNYKAKPNANKGEKKQEAWIDQVQAAIDNVKDKNLKNLLERIKGYSNIPRKKAKFVNFLKNSIRVHGNMPERAWDAISVEIVKNEPQPATNGSTGSSAATNGRTDNTNQSNNTEHNTYAADSQEEKSEKRLSKRERKLERQKKANKDKKKDRREAVEETSTSKKSKKRKHKEIEDEEEENKDLIISKKKRKKERKGQGEEEEDELPMIKKTKKDAEEDAGEDEETLPAKFSKFRWEETITAILKKSNGQELSVKKLRKKVMAAYQEHGSSKPESEEALLAKFQKKITKNHNFKVSKDRVRLL